MIKLLPCYFLCMLFDIQLMSLFDIMISFVTNENHAYILIRVTTC